MLVMYEEKMVEGKCRKDFIREQTFRVSPLFQIVLLCFFSVWDLIVTDGHLHGLPMHKATIAKFSALWTVLIYDGRSALTLCQKLYFLHLRLIRK